MARGTTIAIVLLIVAVCVGGVALFVISNELTAVNAENQANLKRANAAETELAADRVAMTRAMDALKVCGAPAPTRNMAVENLAPAVDQ